MVGKLIAFRSYPSQLTVGSAGPLTGRIAPIGRSDQTGYQIRQDRTCEIGLKYEGRRIRSPGDGVIGMGKITLPIGQSRREPVSVRRSRLAR